MCLVVQEWIYKWFHLQTNPHSGRLTKNFLLEHCYVADYLRAVTLAKEMDVQTKHRGPKENMSQACNAKSTILGENIQSRGTV